MRLRSLDLLRYGHFTDGSVEFPSGSLDFHIVFGPNEAGKSTAMSAIEDLIFGIPGNSSRNFLHDFGAMRVGAELEGDGHSLKVRRRKGNKDTLLTPDDVPLSAGDGALSPFIGGVDRAFFSRMFCLDHDRLRKGGRDILEARDDVGQMLFSAGAGVSGLREHLTAMQAEADSLWASRRAGHRRYYQAEDRLRASETALREHTVTSSKWQELKTAYEKAKEACDSLEGNIETQAAELTKLTRIRRVCRDVHRFAEVEGAIKNLGTIVSLPADALELVDNAAADDATAATRIKTLSEQIDSIGAEHAALTIDEALLQRETDVEQIHKRRIQISASKADLPKRRAELAAAEATLKRVAAELEWLSDNVDEIIAKIPARAKLTAVRTLLTTRSGQLAAVTNATHALEEADEKIRDLTIQMKAAGTSRDVSNLSALTKVTRELGDLDGRIIATERELQDATSICQGRLKAMHPALADEHSLVSMKVPAAETIKTHRDACRDVERRIQAIDERFRAAGQAIERDKRAYARIVSDENIISSEELAQLRQRRDMGWSIIRRRHIDGVTVPDSDLNVFGADGALSDAYDVAVFDADAAADRRFDKAQTTASAMVLSRQIAEQEDGLGSLNAERTALTSENGGLQAEWSAMWTGAPLTPLPPDEMLEWLKVRAECLELIETRDAAERLTGSLRTEQVSAKQRLSAQLEEFSGSVSSKDMPLRAILESAEVMLRSEENASQKRHDLDEALRKAQADAERKRKAVIKAEQDGAGWQLQWNVAVVALGLSNTAAWETVQTQVDVVDEMRETAQKITDLRHERIGKIERDVTAFETDVRKLVAVVAPSLVEREPEEAILELENLLKQAIGIRGLATEKETALAGLREKVDACELSRCEAQDIISKFKTTTGVATLDALRAAIKQSEFLRSLQAEQQRLTMSLSGDGDGLTIESLAEECRDVDVDQISAREQTLNQHLQDLRKNLIEASDGRSSDRREFEAIGGADHAARDAADRQAALAEIGEIAAQYTRVRSASLLLQWSIDRFRREKQAPILKRAGELFSILTDGSFETLQLEFDDKDNAHLAGIRQDGEKVQVPGLSTGAGDQLYLALRIAAVEEYLAHAPALPFIADDLFINYDDDRAAAGFKVLRHLATKTQVLFFTHHQHLVDVAKRALGGPVSAVVLSPRIIRAREVA